MCHGNGRCLTTKKKHRWINKRGRRLNVNRQSKLVYSGGLSFHDPNPRQTSKPSNDAARIHQQCPFCSPSYPHRAYYPIKSTQFQNIPFSVPHQASVIRKGIGLFWIRPTYPTSYPPSRIWTHPDPPPSIILWFFHTVFSLRLEPKCSGR